MKITHLLVALLITLFITTTGCQWFAYRGHVDNSFESQDKKILLDMHNNIRLRMSSIRLEALKENDKLSTAAQKHADYLALSGTFSHSGFGGSRPSARVDDEGYQWRYIAENIALGDFSFRTGAESVENVMKGWMDSPGHRANILGDYQDVGFGISQDKQGRRIWVVVFGRPPMKF